MRKISINEEDDENIRSGDRKLGLIFFFWGEFVAVGINNCMMSRRTIMSDEKDGGKDM